MFFARLLVKLIDPRVHIKRTTSWNEFEWDTNTIYYNPAEDPADVGFMRHLRERHFFIEPERFSSRLWSILHELGHYFNADEVGNYEDKAICALLPYEVAKSCGSIQDLYYDSPDEFIATEWACAWITDHEFLAIAFSRLL